MGSTCLQSRKVPPTFTSTTRRNSSHVVSTSGLTSTMPAIFSSASIALSYVVSALTPLGGCDGGSPRETDRKTRAPSPSWHALWKEVLQGMHFILNDAVATGAQR